MKKIFTLMACLACVCWTQAQTLTFKFEGNPVENGATVYSATFNETIALFGSLTFTPQVTLSCSKTAEVCVELKALEEYKEWGLCAGSLSPEGCVNTEAATGYVATKSGSVGTEDVKLDIDYVHGKLAEGAIVTRKAQVSAWIKGEEDEKISFTLIVTNDDTLLDITDVTVKEQVQVVGRTLSFNFATDAARTLTVYGIDGQQVMQQPLEGKEGKVSLDMLGRGVYVYQILGGRPTVSRKVVIK